MTNSSSTAAPAWSEIERQAARLEKASLLDLFAADSARAAKLSFEAPHLIADFSKQRIDGAAIAAFGAL
ncbi:MAG: glucose-6-phosphate isomerase, partial [Proteobacteria bacterium]|nr:glucose-6-phosphate isomerase [Pseudomonadota bacterium]